MVNCYGGIASKNAIPPYIFYDLGNFYGEKASSNENLRKTPFLYDIYFTLYSKSSNASSPFFASGLESPCLTKIMVTKAHTTKITA